MGSQEHIRAVQQGIADLATLSGKRVLLVDEAEVEALQVLASFDGNGFMAPVTISVSLEHAQNQQEALDAVLAALTKLGVTVRPASRGEGSW